MSGALISILLILIVVISVSILVFLGIFITGLIKHNGKLHKLSAISLIAGILLDVLVIAALLIGENYSKKKFDAIEMVTIDNELEYSFVRKPYSVVNNGIPYFTDNDKIFTDFEEYSELDSLGRCGTAFALISQDTFPNSERGSIGHIKPTGWKQNKYEGIIDSNPPYIYNRCHLIAYCLAGENDNEKNLITGTRYMNIEGMLPFEEEVVKYIEKTDNHVLYRVTPKFTDDNLLADGVLIEAYSIEDNGKGICLCVFCYNIQPGIYIDYRTGENGRSSSSN